MSSPQTHSDAHHAAVRRAEIVAAIALLIGAVAIGFAAIFAKFAERVGEVGPSASAFWRVTLALPILATALVIMRGRNPKILASRTDADSPRTRWRRWLLLALPGVLFAGDLATWHLALSYTSAASSTLIVNVQAVIVGLVGWLLLKETLRGLFVVGGALALAGVALLLSNSAAEVGSDPLRGNLLSLVTACFYASYILSIKHVRKRYSVLLIMIAASAASSLCLLVICIITGERMVPIVAVGWLPLVGLAVVPHCLGQGLIAFSLAKLPASFSAVSLLLQPVATALFAWVLLAESLTPLQIIAGVIVLAGIYLARIGSR